MKTIQVEYSESVDEFVPLVSGGQILREEDGSIRLGWKPF